MYDVITLKPTLTNTQFLYQVLPHLTIDPINQGLPIPIQPQQFLHKIAVYRLLATIYGIVPGDSVLRAVQGFGSQDEVSDYKDVYQAD